MNRLKKWRPGAWGIVAAVMLAAVLSGGAGRPAAQRSTQDVWTVVIDVSWHKKYHGKMGGLSDIDETADYQAHVVQVYDAARLDQMTKLMARATGTSVNSSGEDNISPAAISARISATGTGSGHMHSISRMGDHIESTSDWQGNIDPNLCMVQFHYAKASPAQATFLATLNFTGTQTSTDDSGHTQKQPLGVSIGFPQPGLTPANNATSVPARSIQKTQDGYTIDWSFSENGTEGEPPAHYSGEVHTQVIHGPVKEIEAVIAVDDPAAYRNWLPKGGPLTKGGTESQKGNTLSATIYLRNKSTKKPVSDVAFTAQCRLVNVSHQPGACMNYPIQGGDTLPDLRFDSADNPRATDIAGDGLSLETKKRSGAHDVTVACYDYGAWGELAVKVVTDKGQTLNAVVDTDASRPTLSIPLDDNHNHVADAWEKEKGVLARNLPTKWDEDELPAGQRRNGDGYTLYEEYRGFNTMDGYVRTSPTHKDVFVWDHDGLVRTYYAPNNASEITLHYVDDTMMRFNGISNNPENRWINVNSTPSTTYARQYGIYVVSDDTGRVPDSGGANPVDDPKKYVFDQPMKTFFEIRISPANVFKQFAGTPKLQLALGGFDMRTTLVHEMGHAMGITHHLPPDQKKDRVIDEKTGNVETGETYDSQRGGVLDCAMRYYNFRDTSAPELMKPRIRYCRAGDKGTEIQTLRKQVMKDGKPVFDKDGDPVMIDIGMKVIGECRPDDCWHKIDVKSDP